MESLVSRSDGIEIVSVTLPSGGAVPVRMLRPRLSRATPDHLKAGVLPSTYTSKPLVSVDGDAMFGELAVARLLARDGWDAVWVDTVHGAKLWRGMPHRSAPVMLPAAVRARFDAVIAANGGRTAGFFDVLAWRGDQISFLEYIAPEEHPRRSGARWIEAALAAGVTAPDLWYIVHPDSEWHEALEASS